jgi:hypothetical protein
VPNLLYRSTSAPAPSADKIGDAISTLYDIVKKPKGD